MSDGNLSAGNLSAGNRPPILVTGAHRTGTTWVGKMLTAGGQAAYISEPLNLWHRPGVMAEPVDGWYTYICAENEGRYLPALLQTLAFQYHTGAEIRSLRSRKDFLRMCRDWSIFFRGRRFGQRPLLKDPFAVFSAPWFAQRLGCQVVVTVRHPAAFASSLKRLAWPFDFGDLLRQPLLMRDLLAPWQGEMEAMLANPDDVIGQAALLWQMVYSVVADYRNQYPQIQVVRHEDLSRDPLSGFQTLYRSLSLDFNARARKSIVHSSSSQNPKELSHHKVHGVQLDSRANLHNWKRRLEPAEIRQVRAITEDVAACFYPELDWEE